MKFSVIVLLFIMMLFLISCIISEKNVSHKFNVPQDVVDKSQPDKIASANTTSEKILTVPELLAKKEMLLDKNIVVVGYVQYQTTYCTEIACFFDSIVEACKGKKDAEHDKCIYETSCKQGEEKACNSCDVITLLRSTGGENSIEMRKSNEPKLTCKAQEIQVCKSKTKYDYSRCYFNESTHIEINGTLQEEGGNWYIDVDTITSRTMRFDSMEPPTKTTTQ